MKTTMLIDSRLNNVTKEKGETGGGNYLFQLFNDAVIMTLIEFITSILMYEPRIRKLLVNNYPTSIFIQAFAASLICANTGI
jgi:hypothetical protein